MNYCFTDQWEKSAHDHVDNWRQWTKHLRDPRILEIGSYEGRSAIVWLDIFPNGQVTCVDPFGGTAHGDEYERRFDANTEELRRAGRIVKMKGRSTDMLVSLAGGDQRYDVVYIDGDHTAAMALADGCQAWPLLRSNGVMIFDDYLWTTGGPKPGDTPRLGVDIFLALHRGELGVLGHDWQVAVEKLT